MRSPLQDSHVHRNFVHPRIEPVEVEMLPAQELRIVRDCAAMLNPAGAERIVADFFAEVSRCRSERQPEIDEYFASVPADWYREPFYYTYVQYFGTEGGRGDFTTLTEMLPYLEHLGIRNLYLLPHYRSPKGDHGYDVSAYVTDDSEPDGLGGEVAFSRFMAEARRRGFRVVTDAVFNHTSVQHEWFQRALAGDERYLKYYLLVDDWKWVREENRNGDFWVTYRDAAGNEMERVLIFPDVCRVHWLDVEVNGRKHKVYREFYPFQVDLDLQNPDVIQEIWRILAHEINLGTLGKRTDAIAHWVKPAGSREADGTPETFALHTLVKLFLRLTCNRAIIIPEAVRTLWQARAYLGSPLQLEGEQTTTQGDAMFNFQAQNALREALCFQTSSAWWDYWNENHRHVTLPDSATWINLLGHHDEMYLGFIRPHNREHFRQYVMHHCGGMVYKGGMSAGGRTADCLQNNPTRIAMAFFLLYLLPGIPAIYYGDEIGWRNNSAHLRECQKKQFAILHSLGMEATIEGTLDPRELQRGPIPREAFASALESPTITLIRRLNALWTAPGISSADIRALPTGHDGVLAFAKLAGEGSLVALANLTHLPKVAEIPFDTLPFRHEVEGNLLACTLVLGNQLEPGSLSIPTDAGKAHVVLRPYECLLIGEREWSPESLSVRTEAGACPLV